jgi:zinc protease
MEAASTVGGFVEQRAGPGLARFAVEPAANRDEAAIMKAFDETVAQVRDQGVTGAEVERARNRIRLTDATAQQQTWNRGTLLGRYATSYGGAAGANLRVKRLDEVTPDAVKRAANAYFGKAQQTLVSVAPGGTRASAAPSAAAQASTSSAIERLNRAPISKDVVSVLLPRPKEITLDNGLTLLVAEDARVPLVWVRFEIRGAGPLHDPRDFPGTAAAVAAMLRQGTATRTSQQIAEQLDTFGASIVGVTTPDRSVAAVNATGLSDTFAQWFPIVADLVANASMPADELSLMKRRLAASWRAQRSAGAAPAALLYEEAVYGTAAPPRVTPDSFAALTTDRLTAWRRERYAPQNTILTVAGAIDEAAVEKAVRAALGNWTKGSLGEELPAMPPAPPRRAILLDRPGSVQTSLVIGAPAVDRVHADYLPLVVADCVLGGSPAARLFTILREERGLTFGAYSALSAFKHGGDWRVFGDVNAGRDGEALDAFLAELQRIAAEPIPASELDAAKRSIVASFAVTLEQLSQRVAYLSSRRSYGLSADYWDRYPERIMAISADDVLRTAAKYFDPSRLQIVAVGDASKLEPLLAAKAPVTVQKR